MKAKIMKRFFLLLITLTICISSTAQVKNTLDKFKTVYKDDNVTFRALNGNTWLGTGNKTSCESLYLIEGSDKAVLIDAGAEIPGLDRIVAEITDKPVMLVLTHVHFDHVGAAGCFDQVWINPGDTVNIHSNMPNYKGQVKFLKNRDVIDLGGRSLEVYFTPGHTPGSVTFLEKGTEYGYCGDSFGTGQGIKDAGILIFCEDLETIINTCSESFRYFKYNGYRKLYCGHFYGSNFMTLKRIRFVEKAVGRLKNGELEVKPFDGIFTINSIAECDGFKIRFVGVEQP